MPSTRKLWFPAPTENLYTLSLGVSVCPGTVEIGEEGSHRHKENYCLLHSVTQRQLRCTAQRHPPICAQCGKIHNYQETEPAWKPINKILVKKSVIYTHRGVLF